MFNDVVTARQKFTTQVLRTFADGPKSCVEVASALGMERSGNVSAAVAVSLESGFLAEEGTRDPETGRSLRERRYRLRDNYTRFYLKFIEPHKEQIDAGAFELSSLDQLEGLDGVMGLAFETLVVNNYASLLPRPSGAPKGFRQRPHLSMTVISRRLRRRTATSTP